MSTSTSAPPQPAATTTPAGKLHHQVVIVGGGSGGLTVAARLRRAAASVDAAVVEPSETHYYQPLWTLVGGGVGTVADTARPEASLIPSGTTWVRDAVARFVPEESLVVTRDGKTISYDFLVVAPGIQLDWNRVEGLPEALETPEVTSNWSRDHVEKTWRLISGFRGGTALFTFPATPIKCPGAAQKIAYLADDTFRRNGVRDRSRIVYAAAGPTIFGVEKYARTLDRVVARKGIEALYRHNLVAVRAREREAVLEQLDTGERIVVPYDLLHVAPPQGAPDVVRGSALASEAGWVDVDKHTLQHVRFPNVFSLGDASSLPTSKTGAAIRGQAPVLVENLLAAIAGRPLTARYDGYTACPLVTGYGKLVLAEFVYDGIPKETFPFDQSKERWSMYQLKRYGLPALYWQGMLKGRA